VPLCDLGAAWTETCPPKLQIPAVTAQIAEVQQPLAASIEVLELAAAQATEPEETPPCDDTAEIPEEHSGQFFRTGKECLNLIHIRRYRKIVNVL